MLRVGRPRGKIKDLPLGVYPVKGRFYVRPCNEEMRRIFAIKFPGRKSAPLGADKSEARKQWVKLFATDHPAETAEPGQVNQIIERFELDVVALMKDGTTKDDCEHYCARLKKQFGTMRYAKSEAEASTGDYLRTLHVTQYLRHKDNASRTVAVNREIQVMQRMFKLAKTEWGYTEYNPCLQVEYNLEESRDEYQDDVAFMKVYEKASPKMQCMMDLAQMNGARRGMILRLTLRDIDDARGVWFTPNKGKRTKKPRKPKLANWTPDLRAVIDRALELRSKVRGGKKQLDVRDLATAPLFINRFGKQITPTGFNSEWYRCSRAAGFGKHEFHFHDIKAKSLSDSPNIEDAMERGDHIDMRTTKRVYRRKTIEVIPLASVSRKT